MKYTLASLLFAASALTYADTPPHSAILQWLEQHYDVTEPPLHAAAAAGNAEECRRLIANGADVNEGAIPPMPGEKQPFAETPLMLAARNGHLEICRMLLQAGADVNSAALFECKTPLFEAASAGHADICRLLLQAGADVNACTRTVTTPLMIAAQNGHPDTCRLLLAAKADVRQVDREGDTALHCAIRGAIEKEAPIETYAEIISLLLDAGAPINLPNDNEETAIDLAADLDDLSILQQLLDAEK